MLRSYFLSGFRPGQRRLMRIVLCTFPRLLLLRKPSRRRLFLSMDVLTQAITKLESSSEQVYKNFVSFGCTPQPLKNSI